MSLIECPDCEKYFRGPACSCGYRRPQADNVIIGPWQTPEWMLGQKPCTAEENAYAAGLVRAVLDREITAEQAQATLHQIFRGREKNL